MSIAKAQEANPRGKRYHHFNLEFTLVSCFTLLGMIKKICFPLIIGGSTKGRGGGKLFVMTALGGYDLRNGICLPKTSTLQGGAVERQWGEANVPEERDGEECPGSTCWKMFKLLAKKTTTFTDEAFIKMKSGIWIVL